MNLITVVVPVYNVEKLVGKCLESISQQTYKNLEIIIVNDGSTDGSLTICEKIAKKDARMSIISQKNGGLSAARNTGIAKAKGEYICFIDSDDWLEKDYLEILVQGMKKYQADISVMHFKKVSNFDQIAFETPYQSTWREYSCEEAMEELFSSNDISYSANNKLYKTALFQQTNIEYPVGKLMEDKATTYRLIDCSKKVVVNDSKKYHYYQRADSIMHQKFSKKKFDSFETHEKILTFIAQYYPELLLKVKTRYVYEAIRMQMRMIETNHRDKDDYARTAAIIKKYHKEVKEDKNFSGKLTLLSSFLKAFPNLPYYCGASKTMAFLLSKLEQLG